MTNPVLVELRRNGYVESSHRGSYAIVDASGKLLAQAGDVERPIFARSAIKVLQAIPTLTSGAADAFGFDTEQLAILCSSHNGEEAHVDCVSRILVAANASPNDLECGVHWPLDEEAARLLARQRRAPSPLHNNCSGKHAGFICLGRHLSGDAYGDYGRQFTSGYVRPDHPVMLEVSAAIQTCTSWNLANTPYAIDGCSVPTYAVPLRNLAHAFSRIGTGIDLPNDMYTAAKRLIDAVASAPWMVGGTSSIDTRLMEIFGPRLFCKVGAEGVYCASLPTLGVGLAIKIDDGTSSRAAEVVLTSLLLRLLEPIGEERALLSSLSEPIIRNWNDIAVGSMRIDH